MMTPIEQKRGDDLVALAKARFDPELREIEERVLRHSCGYENPPDWNGPAGAGIGPNGRPLAGWDGPEVRPGLLRWVFTDGDAQALLEPRGLRVWGARIRETLDLSACRVGARLELRYCLVEAPVRLASAELRTLSVRDCTLDGGIDGPFVTLHGSLRIEGVAAAQTIRFDGAKIEGEVRMTDAALTPPIPDSTTAIPNPTEGVALSMEGASVANDLVLTPKLESTGTLACKGIHVSGFLDLSCAKIRAKGTALDLDGANIRFGVFLQDHFESAGAIQMRVAEIGAQFACNGAKLTGTSDVIWMDSTKILGGVFLNDGFACSGAIRMRGSEIRGQLSCAGANLTGKGVVLSLDQTEILGGILLTDGFQCAGDIALLGADIGGQLACNGAKLTSSGDALSLDGATIRGGIFFSDGFECAGTIRMIGAEIGDVLTCDGAAIRSLVAENIELKGDLFWRALKRPETTSLSLVGAKIKAIRDDQASWPAKGNLQLEGLVVEEMDPLTFGSPREPGRIDWLNRQPESDLAEPQPWIHMAGLLESDGHKRAAKRVLFELHRHQSQANWKNRRFRWFGVRWDWMMAWLEEKPGRILYSLLFLVLVGSGFFWTLRAHFAPTSDSAYKLTGKEVGPPVAYPEFQPVVYALENALPVVRLGQDDKWAPDAGLGSAGVYWTLVSVRWFLILAGWAQGLILGAAVGARFRS